MSNEKGNMLIIGLFIGVLVIVGLYGAYYLGSQKQTNNQPIVQNTPKPSVLPTATPSTSSQLSSSDATQEKNYTDPQGKYSFKYPSKDTLIAREGMLFTKTSGIQIDSPYQEPYENFYSFGVSTIPNPNKLDSKTIIENQINELKKGCSPPGCGIEAKNSKVYKVGEVDGFIFHFGAETDSAVVVAVRNDTAYVFSMTGDQGYITDYGLKMLDQILATLKFTN